MEREKKTKIIILLDIYIYKIRFFCVWIIDNHIFMSIFHSLKLGKNG
jgi:hypothetical protein